MMSRCSTVIAFLKLQIVMLYAADVKHARTKVDALKCSLSRRLSLLSMGQLGKEDQTEDQRKKTMCSV